MKVLFAVSNENISESIVKKYQKEYKEIISYKNVYYFNAILKELQKDKSYDRIVISEELEQFANNNYDSIDKFLFDKLDSISDEASDNNGNDIPIILICTDRRTKSESILVKLFGIGIYSAIIGQDRSIDEICRLIRKPRTKKEAKIYYKIESEDVSYQSENENDVSEVEIQNILSHYKRLGRNEEKYVESFDNIASQYNDVQLKLIASFLPLNVRAVLEANSAKYQQIITSSGGTLKRTLNNSVKQTKDNGIKVDFLTNKNPKIGLTKPVIIPSAVDANNVKKLSKKIKEEVQEEKELLENEEKETTVQEPKKRRGRPKKVVEPIEEIEVEPVEEPKKRRGRPRKNPLPEEVQEENETVNLFELAEDDEIENDTPTKPVQEATLPGFEDDYEEEEEEPISTMNSQATYRQTQNNEYTSKINNYEPSYNNSFNNFTNNTRDITRQESTYSSSSSLENLLTNEKKIVAFVGTSKNGTSFLVNNVAENLSSMGIKTAILDATKNRNAYYIYTKNEEELRKVSSNCIPNLINGIANGIKVNKNLTVYTSVPDEDVGMNNYEEILSTLIKDNSLVLIDCDFDTDLGYFAQAQEIYLVQSMDVLTIQPLTAFLRELKAKNILKQDKIRIVINKETKVRSLTAKTIIGGMAFYNDPAMSFMTELFDKDNVKYYIIPFEEQTYSRYLEGLVNCDISLRGYSKEFMAALKGLSNMVYPLINSKQPYRPVKDYGNNKFSSNMNNTLNQMKRNY